MVIIDMMVSVTTCLVQFRDSWVGLVAEQRGLQMQVGANLSITIIMIIVLIVKQNKDKIQARWCWQCSPCLHQQNN